jgi:hypothetical protein
MSEFVLSEVIVKNKEHKQNKNIEVKQRNELELISSSRRFSTYI